MKTTRAPWTLDPEIMDDGLEAFHVIYIGPGSGDGTTMHTVCSVYPREPEDLADGAGHAMADARLISAAPDLLVACGMFLKAEQEALTSGMVAFDVYSNAIETARAAMR